MVGDLLQKKLTILTDMSKDLQIILTDMSIDLQINLTDIHRNLQIILRFSLIFSTYLVFSSYLCTRKSASRNKGCGVIIFKKVLKNDEALPSETDSRAFFFGDQRWNRWER